MHCASVLAGVPPGCYLATKALAEFHGVPKEYRSKALQGLSTAGLVESTLGPTGGYRLSSPPSEITFLDIVEAVEGKGSTFVCTNIRKNNPCLPQGYCVTGTCAVTRVMWEADRAWREKLGSVTLAELGSTLKETLDPAILAETADWVAERS